jgi:UDP-4-amino-4,6-dideoxy-N-acetyl-beta-L-altrosamine transaminase
MKTLPYGKQYIDESDIEAVAEVLRSNWLTTGPKVQAFEEAVAKRLGVRYAISCSSGSAALHMVAIAMKLGKGDVVVVPTITFLATANGSALTGADVVFADVDSETGLMTPETLEDAIERGSRIGTVRAAIPVHMTGQCCDMRALSLVAKKHNIFLVEDAAHAFGTTVVGANGNEIPVGSCSHSLAAVLSFHPVKSITAGEGGMVLTNDPDLAEFLRCAGNSGMTRDPSNFRNHGLAFQDDGCPNPWHYEMHRLGTNYRLSDIHAALCLSQLDKLDKFIKKRREIADIYDEKISALAPEIQPIRRIEGQSSAWHLYVAMIDFKKIGKSRAQLMLELRDLGIGTQVHYIPVHRQPYYHDRYGYTDLRGAEAYYTGALSLPIFYEMDPSDVGKVCKALAQLTDTSL